MPDFLQKWVSGVLVAATMGLGYGWISMRDSIQALERFRTETLPLQLAVDLAQLRTSIIVNDTRSTKNEQRIMSLEGDLRLLEQRLRDEERRQ